MALFGEAPELIRTVVVEVKSGGAYTIPNVGKSMADTAVSFMRNKTYEELSIHCMNTSRHYIPRHAIKRVAVLDVEGELVNEWVCR
jgi:hypothetical protein